MIGPLPVINLLASGGFDSGARDTISGAERDRAIGVSHEHREPGQVATISLSASPKLFNMEQGVMQDCRKVGHGYVGGVPRNLETSTMAERRIFVVVER